MQSIVAVVLGDPAHDHLEAGFEPCLEAFEIDDRAAAMAQHHVVQPELRRTCSRQRNVVGVLIDYPKAHVLEHGHPFRERNRPVVTPDFERVAAFAFIVVTTKLDRKRMALGHAFKHPHVAHRHVRRVGFPIGRRERARITLGEFVGACMVVGFVQLIDKTIRPGSNDCLDGRFERLGLDPRRHALTTRR